MAKLRQQGQQARWYALALDAHRDKEDCNKIETHGTKAEILFKCLKAMSPVSEETLRPREEEAQQLFQEWDRLLPMARRMERDLRPVAVPKAKARRS